jgi:hypothetical protein
MHAAAGRPVWLRQDEGDVVAGIDDARKRRGGKLRSAGED